MAKSFSLLTKCTYYVKYVQWSSNREYTMDPFVQLFTQYPSTWIVLVPFLMGLLDSAVFYRAPMVGRVGLVVLTLLVILLSFGLATNLWGCDPILALVSA